MTKEEIIRKYVKERQEDYSRFNYIIHYYNQPLKYSQFTSTNIKNTMPHHTLKCVVCKGARVLDAQDSPHSKECGFVKNLDINYLKDLLINEPNFTKELKNENLNKETKKLLDYFGPLIIFELAKDLRRMEDII